MKTLQLIFGLMLLVGFTSLAAWAHGIETPKWLFFLGGFGFIGLVFLLELNSVSKGNRPLVECMRAGAGDYVCVSAKEAH